MKQMCSECAFFDVNLGLCVHFEFAQCLGVKNVSDKCRDEFESPEEDYEADENTIVPEKVTESEEVLARSIQAVEDELLGAAFLEEVTTPAGKVP